MKRKIKDYINKVDYAVLCSSIEEWDKINDLLGKKGLTRDYGDISDPDNVFVDCIHINGKGTASKKYYEQKSYIIYSASDFLEEEFKFEVGKWYKINNNYTKFLILQNKSEIFGSEHIYNNEHHMSEIKSGTWVFKLSDNPVLLTDLSEIQQYLPPNHPDLIVKLTSFPLEGCVYDDSGLLIKKEEAMFKKDDYIVVLEKSNGNLEWMSPNNVYKQYINNIKLYVRVDNKGGLTNCNDVTFDKPETWRYATSEEITEYERIGKPFDVTTLIKKEKSLVKQVQEGLKLKGRWLKCIKQCDWNTINVGEYIQILENNSLVPYVEWKDNKENYCIDLDRIDKAEFELMPEGFSPNEKEWIPKVGEYIMYKEKDLLEVTLVNEDKIFNYWIRHIPNSFSGGGFGWKAYKDKIRKALPHEIPITSACILYNGENISKSFEVSQYYEFDGKSFNQDIYIAPITKKTKKLQTITIESTTDLNLNLTKIKSKQIQTIKI